VPIYEFRCPAGHALDVFEHHRDDLGCRTILCDCGSTMGPIMTFGRGLTYFSSKTPRVIWNLGPNPITITSDAQHRAEMKKAGVEWHPPRRGMPGCWGG
jgi:hypothetical protein